MPKYGKVASYPGLDPDLWKDFIILVEGGRGGGGVFIDYKFTVQNLGNVEVKSFHGSS